MRQLIPCLLGVFLCAGCSAPPLGVRLQQRLAALPADGRPALRIAKCSAGTIVLRDGPRVAVRLEAGGADPTSDYKVLPVYDERSYKGEFLAHEQFEGHLLGVLIFERAGRTIGIGDRVSSGVVETAPTKSPEELSDARRRPARCPECGASAVIRILYGGRVGVPEEVLRGEAVQRGCWVSPGDPDWLCRECDHEWFDPDDPDKQAWEDWLAERARG